MGLVFITSDIVTVGISNPNIGPFYCAQRTGMHIVAVEALLFCRDCLEEKEIYVLLVRALLCRRRPAQLTPERGRFTTPFGDLAQSYTTTQSPP